MASLARSYGIVVVFLGLFAFLSISTDQFLTVSNLKNLVDQVSTIGFIACAGTLVMVAGGFDLSVGAIYAMAGVVTAKLVPGVGVVPAMLIGVLVGCGLGLLNGLVTTRVNPLITTLSRGIIFSGVAILISGGFLINVDDPESRPSETPNGLASTLPPGPFLQWPWRWGRYSSAASSAATYMRSAATRRPHGCQA